MWRVDISEPLWIHLPNKVIWWLARSVSPRSAVRAIPSRVLLRKCYLSSRYTVIVAVYWGPMECQHGAHTWWILPNLIPFLQSDYYLGWENRGFEELHKQLRCLVTSPERSEILEHVLSHRLRKIVNLKTVLLWGKSLLWKSKTLDPEREIDFYSVLLNIRSTWFFLDLLDACLWGSSGSLASNSTRG